jgi:superfamily II DNA or RNA helicase
VSTTLLPLRDYQTRTIRAIHEKWDAGVRRPASVLPTGAGKGHPLDTEVPTPDGMRLWGHLKVGDLIFGADGKPTEVTAIFDRGVLPTYRVKIWDDAQDRSISVEVDGEHLWKVRSGNRTYQTLETLEIRRLGIFDRQGRPRWSLPPSPRDLRWREKHERQWIVDIERVSDQPIRCITVAAPDHLYLITRHHIVTHNTVVFSHLAEEFLKANPGKRVLVLSHTDELVNQAADKMRLVAPHRSVGIVKAAQNEVHAEIVSASVQSLRSTKRREQIRNVGLLICDEAHHAVASTYRTIFEHFGAFDEAQPLRVAGFTATLVRGDKAKLSDVWEDVAIKISIAFMIRSGYLLDVKGKRVEVPDLNLKNVKVTGGDYQEGALGDALVDAMAPEITAKAYVEHALDRKGIGFAPTVDSAYLFSKAFEEAGVLSEVVHGALARDERRAILARLKSGETRFVWSVMALTEGFDEPTVSVAVIARPTKSNGLYQQMVGRVLRPDLSLAPDDRGHALILDVVGISRIHGLQSLVDLSTRDDLPEDLDEDLSLLELEDLILDEIGEVGPLAGQLAEQWYVGPAETREFDPLGRDSKRTWGRTPDGNYWLAYVGPRARPGDSADPGGYVIVAPSLAGEPGTWDVAWCTKNVNGGRAGRTEHAGLPFEMALAWAEEEVDQRGGFGTKTLTSKKAKWRDEPATRGMAAKARYVPGWGGAKIRTERVDPADPFSEVVRYWIAETGETLTKGEASEIIDNHAATQRVDALVRIVSGGQR